MGTRLLPSRKWHQAELFTKHYSHNDGVLAADGQWGVAAYRTTVRRFLPSGPIPPDGPIGSRPDACAAPSSAE
jgi:hypothetical protein